MCEMIHFSIFANDYIRHSRNCFYDWKVALKNNEEFSGICQLLRAMWYSCGTSDWLICQIGEMLKLQPKTCEKT